VKFPWENPGPGSNAGCREPMSEHLTQSFTLYSDHVSGNLKRGGVSRKSGEKNIHDNCIQVQNNSGVIKENREASEGSGSVSKKSQKKKNSEGKENGCGFGVVWGVFMEGVRCDPGRLIFVGVYIFGPESVIFTNIGGPGA